MTSHHASQVIAHLNTRNEDSEDEIAGLQKQHESEVVIMMNTVGDPEHLNPIKY